MSCERIKPGQTHLLEYLEHISRYEFAATYVEGKTVLDVACGNGYGADLLLNSGKARSVVGADISEEAINYAKNNYASENLEFYIEDAADTHFNDKTFDIIVSFETIEHINNYLQYLVEMKRILQDDGILVVSTPNRKFASPGSEEPINPFHKKEFFLHEFLTVINNSGFSVIGTFGQSQQNQLYDVVRKGYSSYIPQVLKIIKPLLKARKYYFKRRASDIGSINIENCLHLICVCKKALG